MQIEATRPGHGRSENGHEAGFTFVRVLNDDFMTGLREFEQLRKLALCFGDGQRRAHGKRLLPGAQTARLEIGRSAGLIEQRRGF